jgi:hypothetical protein
MLATSTLLVWVLAAGDPAAGAAPPKPEPVRFELAHGQPEEQATQAQLERLLATYDLERWLFTRRVRVEGGTIPHSHPVLTMSARHLKDDELLLATFLHEQIHWHVEAHPEAMRAAEADLRKLYPKVPVGYPEGADSETSTYRHLVVCFLEIEAIEQLLGELRARQVLDFWAEDHYTWVYREIRTQRSALAKVIRDHRLWVP